MRALRRGDVITALNAEPINDSNLLRNMVASTAPGTEVTLTILRDGVEQQLRATLGELQTAEQPSNSPDNNANTSGDEQLGLNVQPLTPRAAAQLNLPSGTQGLMVTSVDPLGAGAAAGMREGDVIEQINQKPVRSVTDVRNELQRAGSNPVLLLINRRGITIFLTIRPRD